MGHVRDGQLPSHGGTQRLARAVGRGQALRLLLTGETLDVDEALRVGLVHDVADLEDAEALAADIADAGPVAARYVKEAIAASADLPLREGMRLEADLSILLHSTEDRAEGLRAFAEKRKPRSRVSNGVSRGDERLRDPALREAGRRRRHDRRRHPLPPEAVNASTYGCATNSRRR